jgi:dienelactone hydrolase
MSMMSCRHFLALLIAALSGLSMARVVGATNSFSVTIDVQAGSVHLRWPTQPGELFQIERRTDLQAAGPWQPLATNWPASGVETGFTHSNGLIESAGFYRVLRLGVPAFTFDWTGTNFTYTDSQRTFTGVMLKPAGNGPFPAVIINHGAGGTATGYSLAKARELNAWGLVCIGPTLTHAAGGETNSVNMGNCPENVARATACANVLAGLGYVDTNRVALFGHSMGAFATIGAGAALGDRIRTAVITAGGTIPDSAGTSNAAPTMTEAGAVRTPFLMFHCDGDLVVPAVRSELFQQLLNSNGVLNARLLYSSNSIPNSSNWHNIHLDPSINADVLTNTFQWFHARGVLP